jgi:hypothetical protein
MSGCWSYGGQGRSRLSFETGEQLYPLADPSDPLLKNAAGNLRRQFEEAFRMLADSKTYKGNILSVDTFARSVFVHLRKYGATHLDLRFSSGENNILRSVNHTGTLKRGLKPPLLDLYVKCLLGAETEAVDWLIRGQRRLDDRVYSIEQTMQAKEDRAIDAAREAEFHAREAEFHAREAGHSSRDSAWHERRSQAHEEGARFVASGVGMQIAHFQRVMDAFTANSHHTEAKLADLESRLQIAYGMAPDTARVELPPVDPSRPQRTCWVCLEAIETGPAMRACLCYQSEHSLHPSCCLQLLGFAGSDTGDGWHVMPAARCGLCRGESRPDPYARFLWERDDDQTESSSAKSSESVEAEPIPSSESVEAEPIPSSESVEAEPIPGSLRCCPWEDCAFQNDLGNTSCCACEGPMDVADVADFARNLRPRCS